MQKGYIKRNYNPSLKINAIPAKYYIALNGIKFLRTQPVCQKAYLLKLYKEHKKSPSFIDQCLLIADIYLHLLETEPNINFYTQSDFSPRGIIKELSPDFGFTRTVEGKKTNYVAEFFSEIIPSKAISATITKHLDFFTERDITSSPMILFICPSQSMAKVVLRLSNEMLEANEGEDLTILISTQEQVKQQGIEKDIWTQAIAS